MTTFTRTFDVAGRISLSVRNGSGAVRIHSGSPGQAMIEGRVKPHLLASRSVVEQVAAEPPVSFRDSELTIVPPDERVTVEYDITVPADTPLDVITGSGAVECHGLLGVVRTRTGSGLVRVSSVSGGIEVRTGSGSVRVEDCEGTLDADTGSGSVTVSGRLDALRLRTSSGTVRVEGAGDHLDVRTGSGAVTVDGEPRAGAWSIHTGSGTVRLRVPEDAPFRLDAHTGSGRVRSARELGTDGPLVAVRTGSGGVRVE